LIYPYGTETFHLIQLAGFFFLVIGTLVYNEIVVIPYFGFDKNTKVKLMARKNLDEQEGLIKGAKKSMAEREIEGVTNPDYAATSPQAGYDYNRNVRLMQRKMEGAVNHSDNHEIHMDVNPDTDK